MKAEATTAVSSRATRLLPLVGWSESLRAIRGIVTGMPQLRTRQFGPYHAGLTTREEPLFTTPLSRNRRCDDARD
jgi:hypothetical protein